MDCLRSARATSPGWRKGEVPPLRWSQVDLKAGVVRLEPGTTKNEEAASSRSSLFPTWRGSSPSSAAAGLANWIPHDFRRTAVRNLERAGVPRSVAMKLTGHKTENVYRRYAIVSEADLADGVSKLRRLHEQLGHKAAV